MATWCHGVMVLTSAGAFEQKYGASIFSGGSEGHGFRYSMFKKCEVIYVEPLPNDKASALFLDEVGNEELSKFEEIADCLKFSYDHLKEEYKKCFLCCALYLEDYEIIKEDLIELCIEEGFIRDEGGSRHSMIRKGHVIFEKLIDNCMLELVKGIGFGGWSNVLVLVKGIGFEGWSNVLVLVKSKLKEDCVSMHDLLREMALSISPQFMVTAGMALEELPEEHEWREDLLKVSLMNNNIREISSTSSPKCPMLTTLLLSNNNITTISEAFFDQMLGLKILDLSNNKHLATLRSSVSKLENLTTLLLENCESLKEVPSLSNLRGLKKLNFFGTPIEELPQGLNMLTNLKHLLLGGGLSEIPDGLLQNFSKLHYLRVDWRIPLKWEEIGRLRKLESLDGLFSTVDDMSLFVKSGREILNRYRIFVGSYDESDGFFYTQTLSSAMKLIVCCHIDTCKELSWLPSDAQGFYIFDCKDVRSLDDISGFQDATDLQHCTVRKCDGLEFVVSSSCLKRLQNLESLYLDGLKNLNVVFGEVGAVAQSAPLPAGTFSSLQIINITRITWSEYEGENALEKLTLPKLERLVLKDLPALKRIYSGSSTVLICDSIKRVEIVQCREIEIVFWFRFNPLPTLEYLHLYKVENLKSVFDEEALGLSAPPTTFFSLKTIHVYGCSKLKKVFSSGSLLGYFQSLETIGVKSCDQMEELISSSTYEEIEALEKITLSNLQRLELTLLPELKSICSSSNVLICDSIKSLEIGDCEKLKRIPLHLSSLDNGQRPSLKRIQVYPEECWESLEWDQPTTKDVFLPSVKFSWRWP
ncbi:hypothetical protein SLEP1_g46268 [Rubroshorea leprosula]|uniref:Disease resistance protein At4g27190-like leucine-rich repeats domain-containing protein n=1 Tax=Rubroshorea leprosula TaxID=152421 RepID=A0AAV5LLU4_9ROSI|nr:hypothetical protein SLEP1_g46268 [Rubroshorea leprosula]